MNIQRTNSTANTIENRAKGVQLLPDRLQFGVIETYRIRSLSETHQLLTKLKDSWTVLLLEAIAQIILDLTSRRREHDTWNKIFGNGIVNLQNHDIVVALPSNEELRIGIRIRLWNGTIHKPSLFLMERATIIALLQEPLLSQVRT